MTDEVYQYMLDEIQGDLYRAKSRMLDINKYLASHDTIARLKSGDAGEIVKKIIEIIHEIDQLPDLPAKPF